MWQIMWRDIKDRRWSLLAFSLGAVCMLWLYVATYNSSVASTKQLQDLVKTYPKGFLDAIGLSDLSINTLEKYLNAKHFSLLWPLIAIILALSRAGNQLAGETQNGTMGLLLSLPKKRWQILSAKYFSGLFTLAVFTGASVFGVIPLAAAYHIAFHMHALVGTWLLTMLFMGAVYSFGMAVSAWASEKSTVYAITSGAIILSYVVYLVSLLTTSMASLKHYSLFYYFNTHDALGSGHISLASGAVFVGCITIFTAIAYLKFTKRDFSV